MDELDEVWEQLFAEAAATDLGDGRLADFLAVKAANDEIRERAVEQLFGAFQKLAAHANRNNAAIAVESSDRHRFTVDRSAVSGRSIRFRHGVRCLSVEAGWTRTPRDGFMRGNALAVARISHFGLPGDGAELKLIKFDDSFRWFRTNGAGIKISFEIEDLIGHFRLLLK
jgi:hypothetical protein